MSWVAHDLEPYILQRKVGRSALSISFAALVLGSWGPDIVTKWFVHGLSFAGLELRASDPVRFHRGWPGVGFTHSLAFGVAVAVAVYVMTRSRPWALGLMLGLWLHVLSDLGDTVGVMLFFPLTTHVYSIGAWANADTSSRLTDAAAYYSGIGGVWDAFWILLVLASWRVLGRSYFLERIAPRDGFWRWVSTRMPENAALAVYRGALFYGVCRFAGWMLWAHALHHFAFDPSWGGPHWIDAVRLR